MQIKNLNEAIELLRTIVKDSNIKGQPHIDLTLADADKRFLYEEALMITRQAVIQEEITETDLKTKLGLS